MAAPGRMEGGSAVAAGEKAKGGTGAKGVSGGDVGGSKREELQEHEIRVTGPGKERHYISYALSLLEDKEKPFIVLSAMGTAINKSIAVAEIVKLRVPGLHQWNTIQAGV
ncbi:hypothetical protein T484DRAFT_1846783 [Baffinella frigidus]|nr:hypothetical protein T484DRAFT_1846783 [Cryptophyta sp. CCMP2293]